MHHKSETKPRPSKKWRGWVGAKALGLILREDRGSGLPKHSRDQTGKKMLQGCLEVRQRPWGLYHCESVQPSVSLPMQKFRGVGKNSPTVLGHSWTKVHQILRACRRVPVDWHASFRLLISCSVAEIYSVKVQNRSQKSVFCLPACGDKCSGMFGPIF